MHLLQVLSLLPVSLVSTHLLQYNYGYQPFYTNLYHHNLPANYNPLIPYSVYNQAALAAQFTNNPTGHFTHYSTGQFTYSPTGQLTHNPTGQYTNNPTVPTGQFLPSASVTPISAQQRGKTQTIPDADKFADAIGKLKTDEGIKASTDQTSPSAAAALAYMRSVSFDDLCGKPAEIYLQNIFDGKSKEKASAEATRYYIKAYNGGARLPESGACKAAEAAFREAYASDEDPILKSAQAFINNWPGVQDGNPCAVSGVDYVNAIIEGKSHTQANVIASERFSKAFKVLAKQGKPLKDVACAKATKAYFNALPNKPEPEYAAAFTAFIDKIFDDDSKAPAYDPACLASLDAFLEAYNNGVDIQTANLISAKAFFKEFAKGSSVPADSACAAATKAYTAQIKDRTSNTNAAAMIEYINEAIANGDRSVDPVCAAAALAYFDAYIEEKSEDAANEAAAVAYIEEVQKTPDFDLGSPCGKAAEAYIKAYEK